MFQTDTFRNRHRQIDPSARKRARRSPEKSRLAVGKLYLDPRNARCHREFRTLAYPRMTGTRYPSFTNPTATTCRPKDSHGSIGIPTNLHVKRKRTNESFSPPKSWNLVTRATHFSTHHRPKMDDGQPTATHNFNDHETSLPLSLLFFFPLSFSRWSQRKAEKQRSNE